jgi:hypothetical protein
VTTTRDQRIVAGGWNPREDGLSVAACVIGAIGLLGPAVVWGYAGWIALHGGSPDHSQRYMLQILSAASDLLGLISLLAIILGLAAVVRRRVGIAWRIKGAIGLMLGVGAVAATATRWILASHH